MKTISVDEMEFVSGGSGIRDDLGKLGATAGELTYLEIRFAEGYVKGYLNAF